MSALLRSGVVAVVLALGLGAACSEDADPVASACIDYCELMTRNCTGDIAQYTDTSACQATCGAMPLGDHASPTANTIACRTFQAAIAEDELLSPMVCTRAGPGGDGTCGSNCESFCTIALDLCGGRPGVFPDFGVCMNECALFSAAEPYDASDIAGDTFACRLYHLTAASTVPEVHCAHIGRQSPLCL